MARSAGEESTQTSLRLSRELYDRLDVVREGRPLGEEIRRRLEASLGDAAPAAADPVTAYLLGRLSELSQIVDAAYGHWQTDPGAYAVFRLAVDKVLEDYKPAGEPKLQLKPEASSMLRGVTDVETAAVVAAFAATMI
jgi:hypothetical protein